MKGPQGGRGAPSHTPWEGASAGRGQRGQASLTMLAAVGALLAGAVLLFAFGNALGAKGRQQRAVDLAAVSAAQVMRDLYPRLFEPPFLRPGRPQPPSRGRAAVPRGRRGDRGPRRAQERGARAAAPT